MLLQTLFPLELICHPAFAPEHGREGSGELYQSHGVRLFPKSQLSPGHQLSMNELSTTLEG